MSEGFSAPQPCSRSAKPMLRAGWIDGFLGRKPAILARQVDNRNCRSGSPWRRLAINL